MRRILPGDVVALARALLALPAARGASCTQAFDQTHAADKYRKRLGRAHPTWGDGTLQGWAARHPKPPEPFHGDREYARCMRIIYAEIEQRAGRHQPDAQDTHSRAHKSMRKRPAGIGSSQSSQSP